MRRDGDIRTWRLALLAGLAGGAAEVLWVTLYSGFTATSGATVARQVTVSFWPTAAEWAIAPVLGIAIHMALALALAAVLVPLLLRFAARHPAPGAVTAGAIAALALVWMVNFFLVLPQVNPSFVSLMPYGATLASKLLFGLAAGAALQRRRARCSPRHAARAPVLCVVSSETPCEPYLIALGADQ